MDPRWAYLSVFAFDFINTLGVVHVPHLRKPTGGDGGRDAPRRGGGPRPPARRVMSRGVRRRPPRHPHAAFSVPGIPYQSSTPSPAASAARTRTACRHRHPSGGASPKRASRASTGLVMSRGVRRRPPRHPHAAFSVPGIPYQSSTSSPAASAARTRTACRHQPTCRPCTGMSLRASLPPTWTPISRGLWSECRRDGEN